MSRPSKIVRLRPPQKKRDRTAAKRARDYRARKRVTPVTEDRDERDAGVTQTAAVEQQKAPSDGRLPDSVTVLPAASRAEIEEWKAIRRKLKGLKARERWRHAQWQTCRLVFLVVGVAFFALLAYAAVN